MGIISSCKALYNVTTTKTALQLAQASYCVDTANEYQWDCSTCDPNIDMVHDINSKGARALVGYHKDLDSVFVSYRGSTDIQNWIDNIQIKLVSPWTNMPSISVEDGFYKVYDYLKPDITQAISNVLDKYPTSSILLTGHSMGGIATIHAFELATGNVNNSFNQLYDIQLITFGSPRIGNNEFADKFNQLPISSTRVTHYYDMVPHVPQEFLHYCHVHGEVWYNEPNTDYNVCNDEVNESDQCSNSCSPLHCTSIDDHLYYIGIHMGTDGDC